MASARTRFLIVLFATLLMAGITARLGVWQLDRAAEKKAVQAAIDARARLAPLPSAELAAAGAAQLHRGVRLKGHWLADKTVFLDNRPMDGRVGFFVVTPLQLEGRPEAILVQRGWIPRNSLDRAQLPTVDTPTGQVEIAGRLIIAPSRLYEFAPSVGGVIRQNLAAAAFAEEIKHPLLPLTVQQTTGADGLARDWPLPDLGLQKHYGYAFQWFALCALLVSLYVWFQIIRPRRSR